MSKETEGWLNNYTLIGNTAQRGHAWHYRQSAQGAEANHYDGAIPVADVVRRLFYWEPVLGDVSVSYRGTDRKIQRINDTSRRAIIRPAKTLGDDDKGEVLAIATDSYAIHSYREWLLEVVSNILGDSLVISSAGLLRRGGLAWVEVSVPETLHTPEGVDYRPNLLNASSHDNSLASTFKRTITATVCDNTLGAALSETGFTFKVKHTRNSALWLRDAREALGIVHQLSEEFEAEVKELCSTTVTDAEWFKFLDAYTPVKTDASKRSQGMAERKREELGQLWNHDTRVSPWRNTAFGVLQAVNTWSHHLQTVRGAERPERNQLRAIAGDFDALDSETLKVLNKVLVNA